MIHLRCPKDYAWLMVFAQDHEGIYRTFQHDECTFAGQLLQVPTDQTLHAWLVQKAYEIIPSSRPHEIEISDQISHPITFSRHHNIEDQLATSTTLPLQAQAYMAINHQRSPRPSCWLTIPELFARETSLEMKKIINLMWQVLMGGHLQKNCKIITGPVKL